ncbi:PREDICTED: high affinity immunoglobulin epsilon receptor subunit beta [Propithecus coquereli]|uniref:Membrane spanning 4-domains A2 n=1 Tax=Propithecus coquereli TaxID=379532 RepID=A0A2K6EJT6_PROCO|nr:PREDICTED: high affinity immunoglobulin epsilon receptor subunit beta [Propithecus coquereli]
MDTENSGRAQLALPNPQWSPSVSEPGLSEISLHGSTLPKKSPRQHTWLTFLNKELEFLGVTQILTGLICLCFGTIVCSVLNVSNFEEDIFSSFKVGYPFWGAVFFAVSGFLSIISERKNAAYLVRGRLGANAGSSIAGGTGIVYLIINLKNSVSYVDYSCEEVFDPDNCFVASFSTEIVMMILFLTILGFCSAVSLTVYGVGEELRRSKVPEDRLYEELNIYSPIYSVLEETVEESPPTDS